MLILSVILFFVFLVRLLRVARGSARARGAHARESPAGNRLLAGSGDARGVQEGSIRAYSEFKAPGTPGSGPLTRALPLTFRRTRAGCRAGPAIGVLVPVLAQQARLPFGTWV